ncbi:unnamed protein product [Amoebophrya sp. A25]|nr:unnamed protein product [Amoebophrya sp. A25]|eukprot:GSA25T00002901001.1
MFRRHERDTLSLGALLQSGGSTGLFGRGKRLPGPEEAALGTIAASSTFQHAGGSLMHTPASPGSHLQKVSGTHFVVDPFRPSAYGLRLSNTRPSRAVDVYGHHGVPAVQFGTDTPHGAAGSALDGHQLMNTAGAEQDEFVGATFRLGATSRELRRSVFMETRRPLTPFETRVTAIVHSKFFDAAIGCVLLANAVCIGAEQELLPTRSLSSADGYGNSESNTSDTSASSQSSLQTLFHALDYIFLFIFACELFLRFVATAEWRFKKFSRWMWFDLAILLIGICTELLLPLFSGIEDATVQRIKAVRCMRVVRLFAMVEHLWTLALTFLFSVQPLFWTVVFLFIVVFLFAVALTALSADAMPQRQTLSAILSLVQIMTFDDWVRKTAKIVDASDVHPLLMILFFCVFISVAVLALMNLVTAVVFDSASRRANEEDAVKHSLFGYQILVQRAQVEFLTGLLDTHHIYTKARKRHLWRVLNGSPTVQRALANLGLNCEEDVFRVLLPLIDTNKTQTVERDLLLRTMLVLDAVGHSPQHVALIQTAQSAKSKQYFLARALLLEDPALPVVVCGDDRSTGSTTSRGRRSSPCSGRKNRRTSSSSPRSRRPRTSSSTSRRNETKNSKDVDVEDILESIAAEDDLHGRDDEVLVAGEQTKQFASTLLEDRLIAEAYGKDDEEGNHDNLGNNNRRNQGYPQDARGFGILDGQGHGLDDDDDSLTMSLPSEFADLASRPPGNSRRSSDEQKTAWKIQITPAAPSLEDDSTGSCNGDRGTVEPEKQDKRQRINDRGSAELEGESESEELHHSTSMPDPADGARRKIDTPNTPRQTSKSNKDENQSDTDSCDTPTRAKLAIIEDRLQELTFLVAEAKGALKNQN